MRRAHGPFLPAGDVGDLIAGHPELFFRFQETLVNVVVAFPVVRPAAALIRHLFPGDRESELDRYVTGEIGMQQLASLHGHLEPFREFVRGHVAGVLVVVVRAGEDAFLAEVAPTTGTTSA